jgi:capsular exopolysaccharide synthesis family protein
VDFEKLQIREHLRVVYKHRWLIVLCTFGVAIPLALLLVFSKAEYEASIAFEVGDDAFNHLLTSDIDVSPDLSVGNYMDLIASQSFARRVVLALANDSARHASPAMLKPEPENALVTRVKHALGFTAPKVSAQDEAVIELMKKVKTEHRGGQMIRVLIEADQPQEAYLYAKTIGEEFVALNREEIEARIRTLNEFYHAELNNSYQRLVEAEGRLVDYRRKHNLASSNRETGRLSGRVETLESQLVEITSQRKLVEGRMAGLDERLANMSRKNSSLAHLEVQRPRIEELKTRLLELQQELNTQTAIYTPKHAKVVGLKREIEATVEELRSITGAAPKAAAARSDSSSMAWQELFIERLLLEVEISSLRAKEESLRALAQDYRDRLLDELPEQEKDLLKLQREVQVAQDAYQAALSTNEKLKSLQAEKALNVNIVDYAERPLEALPRKRGLKLAVGFFLGIALGIAMAYFREAFDRSLKTTRDVETKLKLAVAGVVENFEAWRPENKKGPGDAASKNLVLVRDPDSEEAESFYALRANLEVIMKELHDLRVLMITSPGPGEGKSTIAQNLAASFASYGKKTILLDTDLYHPTTETRLGLEENRGLTNWLAGEVSSEALTSSLVMNGSALDVIPTGNRRVTFQKLAHQTKLRGLLARMREHYEVVIIDAPPIIPVSDPLLLAPETDMILLVLEAGRTQFEAARQAIKILQKAKPAYLGAVLNRFRLEEEYGPRSFQKVYRRNYYRSKFS